jgi:hypothetical protein
MRRGGKPAKAKVEAKLPVARKSPKNEGSRVRDLEKLELPRFGGGFTAFAHTGSSPRFS